VKHLITILLLFFAGNIFSQDLSTEVFHEGFVVTNNRDTIRGAVAYNMEWDVIYVLDPYKSIAIPTQNLYYFEIWDVILDNNRQFYTISYTLNPYISNYSKYLIFELQYEGNKLSLITREKVVIMRDNGGFLYKGIVHNYFFIDKSGTITTLRNAKCKKCLMEIFENKEEIKKYIRKFKLHYWELNDLIRITAFYNAI
jgi:hypothetical protein